MKQQLDVMTMSVTGEQTADPAPPHILVVDDEPAFVDLVKNLLEQAKYRITPAYSGEEALRTLRRVYQPPATGPSTLPARDGSGFDLVLLDISMPGMGGIDVCHQIRGGAETAKIPVLVLTALTSTKSRTEALKAGANDYLTKPFQSVELLARVRNLIGWHRAEKEAQVANTILFERLQRHSHKLAGLNQVMGAMLAKRDVPSVLSVIVDGLVTHWDAAFATVWLLEQDRGKLNLILQASAGVTSDLENHHALISLNSPCKIARVAALGQGLLSTTLEDSGDLFSPEWIRDNNLQSFVGFPLFLKGQLMGVLALFTRETLPQSDFELLRTFAHQATAAIENAHLYYSEQQRVAELTAVTRELERSQVRLVQSEKMAAAGRLAASLAHEINNPLQAVHNCLELAQRFPLEKDEHLAYLTLAGQEVERLITLVNRILEFCRPSRSHRILTNVNDLIEHVIALAQKKLQHSEIELHRDLSPDIPPVHVVPDQISQVILNLIVNAIEALPEGGRVALSSQHEEGWIKVSVKDSGPGLTSAEIEHLFEPFFTTKPAGTGLGLAISFGIIERHGGTIQVASNGDGAAFTVLLPVAPDHERIQ